MKIVVTGSAGFIGKNLIKHLRDQNHDVTEFEYTENKNGKLVSTGEKFSIKADMVFRAIGQTFESSIDNLPKLENGRILVDNNYKTTISGIWAGGDCVKDGEDLTVSAVEAGKIAANSIHNELVS